MECRKILKTFFILFFIIILIFCLIITLLKISEFMKAYSECKDDFEMIEKCQCFPDEGNYSYFEKTKKEEINYAT